MRILTLAFLSLVCYVFRDASRAFVSGNFTGKQMLLWIRNDNFYLPYF